MLTLTNIVLFVNFTTNVHTLVEPINKSIGIYEYHTIVKTMNFVSPTETNTVIKVHTYTDSCWYNFTNGEFALTTHSHDIYGDNICKDMNIYWRNPSDWETNADSVILNK